MKRFLLLLLSIHPHGAFAYLLLIVSGADFFLHSSGHWETISIVLGLLAMTGAFYLYWKYKKTNRIVNLGIATINLIPLIVTGTYFPADFAKYGELLTCIISILILEYLLHEFIAVQHRRKPK